MAEITGGELLMECLAAQGVEVMFSIPDGTYNIIFKWIHDHGKEKNMRMVTMRHEAAGAHMADGYARVSGKPAVVMSCAGPGAANMISGVITAHVENIPMIAITTSRRTDLVNPNRGGMQVFDQVPAYRAVTKNSIYVTRWENIPDAVADAFRRAISGVPGPVHIDIAEDVVTKIKGDIKNAPPRPKVELVMPAANPDDVAKAAEMLVNAKTPLLYAGAAVVRGGAWEELEALADYLGIPVTASPGGRGALPEDHPLCIPTTAGMARAAAGQSDVVFVVGGRFGELDFYGKPPLWGTPENQKIIQNHIDISYMGLNRPVDVPLIGHCKVVLKQVLEAAKKLTDKREPIKKLKEYKDLITLGTNAMYATHAPEQDSPIVPGSMMKKTSDFFGKDGIMVMDGGNTSLGNAHINWIKGPRQMLWTSDFGHLGTGTPYAIGAKLAAPDKPVFMITGDSAFFFNVQEMETALRENLPIICVINVDHAWGMEKNSQNRTFGHNDYFVNVEHKPIRHDKIAEAIGCFGAYVTKLSELEPALKAAVDSGKPAIIHVEVDPVSNTKPAGLEMWVGAKSAC
jgi:acetolactate synthase-1/2/3 large subunit